MTPGLELRRLKSEIINLGPEILYKQNCSDLRKISEVSPPRDKLLKEYLECVILKHLSIVEEFINELDSYKGREEFEPRH